MKMIQRYLCLAVLSGLTACSTMSAQECLSADWYSLGLADGAAGYTMSFFNERAGDCAKHGVVANRQIYAQARQQGLKRYCTQENGYQQGYHGRTYRGVCRGRAAKRFLSAYQKGKRIYEQKKQVNDLQKKIRATERDIARHDDEQYRLEKQIISQDDKGKRAVLLLELNRIRHQMSKLEAKKIRLQQQYRTAQKRLNRISPQQ
ncbi:MAG: hypothetical protein CR975_03450 [Gammaproteobacteria bacterium]|nr:MAG: hypothetical protein CR975_03450 [Gammaproteobacteria bacterium]